MIKKNTGKETVQEVKHLLKYTRLASYRMAVHTEICLRFLQHHTAFSAVGMEAGVSRRNM